MKSKILKVFLTLSVLPTNVFALSDVDMAYNVAEEEGRAVFHLDTSSIVFSENFSPIKFKNKVCFISNFFDLSFSIPTLKKLYEDLSSYSNNFLQDYVVTLKKDILKYGTLEFSCNSIRIKMVLIANWNLKV